MKLYMHPVSTVCRPIRLMCAENGIKVEEEVRWSRLSEQFFRVDKWSSCRG